MPTSVSGKLIDAGETERFGVGILPVSRIDCGLPWALSVMLIAAVWLPPAEGVKVTVIEQLLRGAKLVTQPLF